MVSGVSKDIVKAYAWLSMSDSEVGVGYFNKAKEQMSDTQIKKAKAFAAACIGSEFKDCH
jgi:hypothetical protein